MEVGRRSKIAYKPNMTNPNEKRIGTRFVEKSVPTNEDARVDISVLSWEISVDAGGRISR